MNQDMKGCFLPVFVMLIVLLITCSVRKGEEMKEQIQTQSSIQKKDPTYSKCTVDVYYNDGRREVHIIDVYEDKLEIYFDNGTLICMKYKFKNVGLVAESVLIGKNVKSYEVVEEKPIYVTF